MRPEELKTDNETRKKLINTAALNITLSLSLLSAIITFFVTWEGLSEIIVTLQYAFMAACLSLAVSAGGISIISGLKGGDIKNHMDLKQAVILGFGVSLLIHICFFNWFFT